MTCISDLKIHNEILSSTQKKKHTHRHNEINACKGMTTNFFFRKLHIHPIDHELVTLPSTLGESILCFGNTNSASVLVFSIQ